ncbi:glucose-methanol-choline (gmc) oxidoreductase protein [Rutstroemia sp. NJR-2017a BVV2]|nr:glucose-methanol-choline (gmc) oxidoreductase protein [Rutstroemia sp. NJR-2017a BVV2]
MFFFLIGLPLTLSKGSARARSSTTKSTTGLSPPREQRSSAAKSEVIVVIETPTLLMISGISPVEEHTLDGVELKAFFSWKGETRLIIPSCHQVEVWVGACHLPRAGPMHDGALAACRREKRGPLSRKSLH